MDLQAGGGSALLERSLGTPTPVDNLLASEAAATGPELATAIVSTVLMFAAQRSALVDIVATVNNIRLGIFTPNKLYVGNTEVSKIYIGTTLVYLA